MLVYITKQGIAKGDSREMQRHLAQKENISKAQFKRRAIVVSNSIDQLSSTLARR